MNELRVVSEKSDRLTKKGKPYTDYYLVWNYNQREYKVRIRAQFVNDLDKLYSLAKYYQSIVSK